MATSDDGIWNLGLEPDGAATPPHILDNLLKEPGSPEEQYLKDIIRQLVRKIELMEVSGNVRSPSQMERDQYRELEVKYLKTLSENNALGRGIANVRADRRNLQAEVDRLNTRIAAMQVSHGWAVRMVAKFSGFFKKAETDGE